MGIEYWLWGDIPPGPIKATVMSNVDSLAKTIMRYKNPVLLVGSQIAKIEESTGESIVEKIAELAAAINADIVTTSSRVVRELDSSGYRKYWIKPPLEAVKEVAASNSYDLVIVIGFQYAYAWLLLNYLKHYVPHIKTLSIEPYAQPNATWTMPSLPLRVWYKNLCKLIEKIREHIKKLN
ncbi:MAG: hypothetical protein DRO13_04810 [Thermoprotei archaeon]|nr:MAG: hypothetical protein DRO13_04810 [Thermoprotei archaeon]